MITARVLRTEKVHLHATEDIVAARQFVRKMALELGFGLVEQTKIVTAASELARNTVQHGGGGTMFAEIIENHGRPGLRLIFEDPGPGIPDVALAMKDGYTTGGGLGLGLGGAKRLSNDFDVQSTPGHGTRVTFVRWKP